MLCALIMAGGKGTRFWPLSTEEKPKQFLHLLSDRTMLQMTVDRIKPIIPIDRIFISTGERYVDLVKTQLPDISEKNIIVEPEARNTAPCIALSTLIIKRYFDDPTIVVLPSDHLIVDEGKFINTLKNSYEFINDHKKAIITLGMKPNRPETGYGYIEIEDRKVQDNEKNVVKVNKFVEKPNYETALKYLESNRYLWNGGMFIWKANNTLSLLNTYMPDTYNALKEIVNIDEKNIMAFINDNYHKTDEISIDYGIMEKAEELFVIPCDFGWDDVGNWTSIERYGEKDIKGNVILASGYPYKSNNNIVLSNKKVLLNNVEDLIIVETEEYLLISSKRYEQEIKNAKSFM